MTFLREAPLRSRVQNRKCPFVRPFVRSSVRKIIHFCGRHMRGGHIELLTGSLTHRFFGIPKVDPPKQALRLSIRRSRVPFFEHKKVIFLQNIAKNGLGVFTRCICYQYCTFSNWRCVTCAQRGYWIVVRSVTVCSGLNNVFHLHSKIVLSSFAPLPCTVYLVNTGYNHVS